MALDILSRRLDEIDEAALQALETGSVPESLELEYKRELDLSPKDQRREAAKDVSAMANTAGGRLLYGVDEKPLADGTKAAGPIVALKDGAVIETLANVLATTIHPRPLVAFQRVNVTGGFVLVVEVRPSPTDLHMVTGYGENRYYRRLPGCVVPMTEPEVRDAYAAVLATRSSLEARERELLGPELKRRDAAEESIVVLPLRTTFSLVNPGDLGNLRADVEAVLRCEGEIARDVSFALRTEADGCRAQVPDADTAYLYLAVLKSGLLHWSLDGAFDVRANDKETLNLSTSRVLARILEALELARRVYERAGYHGPVRVHYILRTATPFTVDRNPHGIHFGEPEMVAADIHRSTGPVEAYLGQRGYSRIAKALMDPIFHAAGIPAATWFDDAGAAKAETRKAIVKELSDLLD